ncbi:hypothetical protein QIS99_17905 [Streptomyces sp. B-S-A8]|uniref:Uncharacterized protein n=1 Tax=Streptomyces solicavernae TaxID=3043614 RepID=A0ABT6RWM3_9ACTN|nr:hypothetical protein [Streptomyces sp. B-S-A8]MDI3388061.1 hypothetical protein [Streptomyces sp. B-S-A8]
MATRYLLAVAPHPPAEDIGMLPEGGVDAACAAVERLFPGRYAPVADPSAGAVGQMWAGTYGPSVLIVGETAGEARVPQGHGAYGYAFQTAALAVTFEVAALGLGLRRYVALSPESVDFEEGAPLPFEGPFRGAEGVLDTDGLSVAAQRWMFGAQADAPDPAHWIDFAPLHAFGLVREAPGHR